MAIKAVRIPEMTRFIQNSHRRNVKNEATADPKCDSISFIRCSQGMRNV